jgi:hypothetical protein
VAVATTGLRERRAAKTRDAIVRAALDLFEERGTHVLSLLPDEGGGALRKGG